MASRENISAIIELTDEKGSRVTGAAHRSGALSLRDEAATFARSASQRRASANRDAANPLVKEQSRANRTADAFTVQPKRCGYLRASKHRRPPIKAFGIRFKIEENG
jgi:hypothetical protein